MAKKNSPASEGPYAIGYGKPPKETRFRKGQSGNPKGRPKKSRNIRTILNEELWEGVAIVENGKRKTVPYQTALIKILKQRTLNGDLKAVQPLLNLVQRYGDDEQVTPETAFDPDVDAAIVKAYSERLRKYGDDPEGNSNE